MDTLSGYHQYHEQQNTSNGQPAGMDLQPLRASVDIDQTWYAGAVSKHPLPVELLESPS